MNPWFGPFFLFCIAYGLLIWEIVVLRKKVRDFEEIVARIVAATPRSQFTGNTSE
jgi:hypothetical protein